MKNLYQFITSTSYLKEPPFAKFPPQINTQSCTSNQLLKDNATIAYEKMDIFKSPLYMALSYEENQGPLHNSLAQVLWDISTYVNASTVMLSREMQNKGFPVPTTAYGNSTAQMNRDIRVYLQALVNINLLKGPITDDKVTIYRNYVVLHSLSGVIKEAAVCVYNL
ncbi:unnamed protein product [Porites lobata]|uniref:Uncharacterized protein n=1 Tax=Porites lobata TaxID=104759 RepID=A0ABN8RFJ9_9CNID|nr:unnamed protein product [Porites lobata]CAH3178175.1 unnamed protein product [Porites lobata]